MFNYIKNKLKLHVCTVSSLQLKNITLFFHLNQIRTIWRRFVKKKNT